MQKLWLSTLFLVLCVAISGCASTTPKHNIIKNSTPVAKDVVASIKPADFDAADFKASDGTILQYRVLAPSNILPGKFYPLVLQLHGSGGIGTDNLMQLDRLAKTWAMPDLRGRYQAYVLIPQFPIRSANYGPPSPDQHAEYSSALNAALELVEEFISHHVVDKSKIYAVGFSMGGSATWLAPTLRPNLFAAVVPVSGIAPENSFAPIFKDLPALVIHGNSDTENPITADRRFANEVVRIGGKNILFREYEGLDHQLPAEIFPGYWWRDWLFKQSRQ
ncbi:MAG TPA: prolyl oligopeptidase family serine peptidase [Pseudoxanthomonas sp.]